MSDAVLSGPALTAEGVRVGYRDKVVLDDLTVHIPEGSLTMIIGPNGCGKSTLLHTFARILTPTAGRVLLGGREVGAFGAKEFARELSLLPQSAIVPSGVRVSAMVGRGRYPYQRLLHQWSDADTRAVERAMAATGVDGFAGAMIDELSGGQRQRVWLAMLLAQETDVMLLDEPTSYLDIANQYELLELMRTQHDEGKTQVVVLHDLAQAARYASHLIVMDAGRVVATGTPHEIITEDLLRDVFQLPALVAPDPISGTPAVYPLDPRDL
ncbi:iron complex transport system ATP-binding protein [Gordonia amarae]|nr:ABC transporter ATP-binding protein [Gordonia amarae]MCS3876941.1 iron complex transport system ATP-binding protein [Gordonia amarae]GAB07379.1 putative ABC transporter ATP-binding protein [Gordonia amarae NBRC 15530]